VDPEAQSSSPASRAPAWLWVSLALAALLWLIAPQRETHLWILRWISAAIVIAIWPQIRRQVLEPLRLAYAETQLQPPWPNLALVVLFLGLLFPVWAGEPPVSRDHAIHYFQSARFVDAWHAALANPGIPSLAGWSDSLNAGYPYGDSYPLLGYALTSAAHLLSGGLIALRTSYAFGIVAVWALVVWSVRALAIRSMREISEVSVSPDDPPGRNTIHAWAGAAAAACFLLDPGESREGGWVYCMFHGVWPQLLASGAWLASLELSLRCFTDPTPRRIGLASLALGAALVAHPFAWPCAAMSALVLFLSCLWSRREQRGQVAIWIVIHLAALALAASSLTRFFTSASALVRGPVVWERLSVLLLELVASDAFSPAFVAISASALVGALLMLHRALVRPPAVPDVGTAGSDGATPRFSTLWCALVSMILVCASLEVLTVLRLDLLIPSVKNLQFPRFAIVFRPLWAVAGGVGFVWLVDLVSRQLREKAPSPADPRQAPSPSSRVGAAILAAPLLVATLSMIGGGFRAPVGHPQVLWKHEDQAIEARLRAVLTHEVGKAGEGGVGVAFLRKSMSPRTYPIFSITDAGARLILDEHVPAVNYRHSLEGRTLASLHALGATHLLHDRPLDPKSEGTLAAALEPVWSGGSFTLSRIAHAKGRALPWSKVEGSRDARASVRADGSAFAIEVDRASGPFELLTAIGPYFRWRLVDLASGEQLELGLARPSPGLTGMRLHLPGKGSYRLEFSESPEERLTRLLSWMALIALLATLLSTRRLLILEPAAERAWSRQLTPAFILALSLFAAIIYLRQENQLQHTWGELWKTTFSRAKPAPPALPRFRELSADEDFAVSAPTRPHCSSLNRRDARPGCSRASVASHRSVLYRHPFLFRCLSVHLDPAESRTLTLRAAAGRELVIVGAVRGNQDRVRVTYPGEDGELDLRPINPSAARKATNPSGELALRLSNHSRAARRVCIAAALVEDSGSRASPDASPAKP
jgi:hypothetical protein